MKTKKTATIFFVVFICSCAPDIIIEEIDDNYDCYPTIAGDYDVNVGLTADSCVDDADYDVKEDNDLRFWLHVIVQEENDDGSYLADLYISNLSWYDVEIEAGGVFDATLDLYENNVFLNKIYGVLTPEYVSATIELEMNFEELESCEVVYEFEGYPLYCRMAPPENIDW